jgi:hypothetical protein
MTMDSIMIIIYAMIIISLVFTIYIMYVRIQQLLLELDRLTNKMELTGSDLEQLTRRVEDYKASQT